jgi:hypothetical protein
VPVRWSFVVPAGLVVFGILAALLYYGTSSLWADPASRKNAISFVKSHLP